jgi:hypothetical protein
VPSLKKRAKTNAHLHRHAARIGRSNQESFFISFIRKAGPSIIVTAVTLGLLLALPASAADEILIRIQSVIPTSADEVVMLEDFAGAGVGFDNMAYISWNLYGGGRELYERLWDEMGVNVVGFLLQPVGPEALGWFKGPIESLADMQGLRFRTPAAGIGSAACRATCRAEWR